MRATILTIDKPNKNNTIYPREVVEKAIKEFQLQIQNKRCLISNGNPDFPHLKIGDVAAIVSDMNIEDNNVIIDFELLDTPAGIEIKNKMPMLEEAGLGYKVTMVGLGKTEKNENGNDVVTNYEPSYLNFYIKSL